MFHNVDIFIFVFDMKNENEELAKDLNFYQTCLSAICEHSPSAKVFCLIHKTDLVAQDQRKKVFFYYYYIQVGFNLKHVC